ncbi:MAG: DVU3141 family protein [Aliiglaciecola sp.]|uniref:DVU3141 family protein n=1 Tax=Aliiglaciecola sp. TaxID=1872441 RepID=UPI003298F50F
MKKLSSFFLLSILVQGCTSIDQPIASRALVEHEFVTDVPLVSSAQQAILSQSSVTKSVQLNGQSAILGKPFFSASGKTCRKVKFLVDGQRVYCQTDNGGWYPVSPVLASYNEAAAGGNQ